MAWGEVFLRFGERVKKWTQTGEDACTRGMARRVVKACAAASEGKGLSLCDDIFAALRARGLLKIQFWPPAAQANFGALQQKYSCQLAVSESRSIGQKAATKASKTQSSSP